MTRAEILALVRTEVRAAIREVNERLRARGSDARVGPWDGAVSVTPPLRPRGPGEAVGTPGTYEAGPPPPRPPTPPTPPLGRMPW